MKPFYMVLNPATYYTKYRHESYRNAKEEAVRLARQHPGIEFIILQAMATAKINDVIVDEVKPENDDNVPF